MTTLPLSFKTTRFEIDAEMQSLLATKLQKLEKFISPDESPINLEIHLKETNDAKPSGYINQAEINLQVGGDNYYANNVEATMEAAVDQVIAEIETQLRRDHDRSISERRRGGKEVKEILRNQ